jgi:hypothetical protein
MKTLFAILFLTCLIGCSTTRSPGSKTMLSYPERTLADWQREKAVAEARKDIVARTVKIYISGTIVAGAPGVNAEQESLVRSLPNADAGTGCVISDMELRKAQFEYARRYNEYVVHHLSNR